MSHFEYLHRIIYTILMALGCLFIWADLGIESGRSPLLALGVMCIVGGIAGHIWFAKPHE